MRKLLLLFSLFAAVAYGDTSTTGGARVIENPTQDGDIKIRINDGGVKTDAITVTGATGATIVGGSSGISTNYHTIYGSTLGRVTSGNGGFSLFAPTVIDANANAYRDSSGVLKSFATTTGYTNLSLTKQTSSSGLVFELYSNYQDAQTAGSNIVATNQKSVATAAADGTWTLGPSGGTMIHSINGNLNITGTAGTGNVLHGCTRRTATASAPTTSIVVACSGNEIAVGGGCTYSGGVPGGLVDNALLASSYQCQYTSIGGATAVTAIAMCCNK